MSRGKGWVQEEILEILVRLGGEQNSFAIAAEVFEVERNADGWRLMTEAQLATVRRALSKLQAEGAAYKVGHDRAGRGLWAMPHNAFVTIDKMRRICRHRAIPKSGPLRDGWEAWLREKQDQN